MQRALAFIFGFIGLFNIVAAIIQLADHPGLGVASIGVFGLAMLALGIGLCSCEECKG